jgi:hypothetical protein
MPGFRKSGLRTKESFAAGLKLGLSDFITSSPHSELGRADEKEPPALCRKIAAAQLDGLNEIEFGAMASKRGPSATSMIALWGYTSS